MRLADSCPISDSAAAVVAAADPGPHAPTDDWQPRAPHAIALVDLDEGPGVMALAGDVSPGDRVAPRPGDLHALPCVDWQA